jgi:(1->4)-alpha-D-glucan 1-alpha-D-glucosylmutase
MLEELKRGIPAEEIMRRVDSGLPKLWVTHCALDLRSQHPEWFGSEAGYSALPAAGAKAENIVAFMRASRIATVVTRWPLKVGDNWGSTTIELPAGRWRNALTGDMVDGARMRVQSLVQRFPVALLTKESD